VVEQAHVKGRAAFSENQQDRIFNIVNPCPTCHAYFDLYGAFTIHHEWRCWVFSDMQTFRDSSNKSVPNPFLGIKYAYCKRSVQRYMDSLEDEYIRTKQVEFNVRRNIGKLKFFEELKDELRSLDLWDEQKNKPRHATLTRTLEFNLSNPMN